MLDVKNKRIAVIGLSRTGVAVARMLVQNSARVVVSDVKGPKDLGAELEMLKGLELEYDLQGHSEKSLNVDMVVVSPGVPLDIPYFRQVQQRKIPVISEIELAYQFTKAKLIAITGTNGKTTTTSLLGDMLQGSVAGKVRVAGNIGTPLIKEAVCLTENDWIVAEISSFQLETIRDFHPVISLYLNFTPDHLDRHKNIENYWQAKQRIFENQTDNDLALLNQDDPEVIRAAENCEAEKYYVSVKDDISSGAFYRNGKLVIFDKEKEKETEIIDKEDIPLLGDHNFQNVAFAALAAYLVGVNNDKIRKAIIEFKPAAHRLEEIGHTEDEIIFIDDSKATNPDASIRALHSFDRDIVLVAGGQDRNADFTEFVEIIRKKVKTLILLGETKEKIKTEVLKDSLTNINIEIVDDMNEAVKKAYKYLNPGDCLLLSPGCPSWDMYGSYKERGNHFKRELEILRGN